MMDVRYCFARRIGFSPITDHRSLLTFGCFSGLASWVLSSCVFSRLFFELCPLPFALRSGIDAFELPVGGGEEGEAEEVVGFEFDVPFEPLPAVLPPVSRAGKRAFAAGDTAAVGPAEDGERGGG